METIANLWAIVQDPRVWLVMMAIATMLKFSFAYVIKTKPKAKDVAQDLADLSEEVEPWVRQAEMLLLRGDSKYSSVIDKAQAWMKEQGIEGAKGRVLMKYLPALIEIAVKKVDPKK